MKLASTPFWLSASAAICVLFALAGVPRVGRAGSQSSSAKRKNEVTLGGIRPGRDLLTEVTKKYGDAPRTGDYSTRWMDNCRKETLVVDADEKDRVEVVRVEHKEWVGDCVPVPPSPWRTGRGLRVSDECNQTVALYGNPDSRSPSTKGGQPLELLYYAFDWAGPDVPQVMQVVCTPEQDDRAGRVVEITLAASSL